MAQHGGGQLESRRQRLGLVGEQTGHLIEQLVGPTRPRRQVPQQPGQDVYKRQTEDQVAAAADDNRGDADGTLDGTTRTATRTLPLAAYVPLSLIHI